MTNGGVIVVWINLDTYSRPHADRPDWCILKPGNLCVWPELPCPPPPTPLSQSLSLSLSLALLHPFLSLDHPFFFLSKFEIKEQETGHKKGSSSQPTMVFSPSDYPYCACPALPPFSLFPSTYSTHFASCNPALQPGNGNQPLLILYSLLSTLYHLTSSPSSFPLLHRAPLPTPPAVMFSICFDGSSSERGGGGNDSGPWHAWQGLQLDTAPAAPKNKLTGACSGTSMHACVCVCVCVCVVQAYLCVHKYFFLIRQTPALSLHPSSLFAAMFTFLGFFFSSLWLFPHFCSHTGSVRRIKISVRCSEEHPCCGPGIKCERIPSRMPFQWTKCGQVSSLHCKYVTTCCTLVPHPILMVPSIFCFCPCPSNILIPPLVDAPRDPKFQPVTPKTMGTCRYRVCVVMTKTPTAHQHNLCKIAHYHSSDPKPFSKFNLGQSSLFDWGLWEKRYKNKIKKNATEWRKMTLHFSFWLMAKAARLPHPPCLHKLRHKSCN